MHRRRNHTSSFKAKVALVAAGGGKTINEIASQFNVHPNQVSTWKRELLAGVPEIFNRKRGRKKKPGPDLEKDELLREIGRLKMESDWLKKNLGMLE